jgi:hypothetical protein
MVVSGWERKNAEQEQLHTSHRTSSTKRIYNANQDITKTKKESTVGWIRTSDLPTLERENRNLGKANRGLGYQVGCADHCTTTAFWVGRT